MFRSFFGNLRWAPCAYGGPLVLLTLLWAQVQTSVAMNTWQRELFDLLENAKSHSIEEFYPHALTFIRVMSEYSFFFALSVLATAAYAYFWRKAMTRYYTREWHGVRERIEGVSQRIQEDCKTFSSGIEGLGLQVAAAFMTLFSFLPILWRLSTHVHIPVFGSMPGGIMWVTVITSIVGTVLLWLVSTPLRNLNVKNEQAEAALRKELVYGEDDRENYAKPERIDELFGAIGRNNFRLIPLNSLINLCITGYNQLMALVPIICVVPSLFPNPYVDVISWGLALQVMDAFSRVSGSFALFAYNMVSITQIRAARERLRRFEDAIKQSKQAPEETELLERWLAGTYRF